MNILDYVQSHYQHFEWRALVRLLKRLPVKYLYFKSSNAMSFAAREIERVEVRDDGVEVSSNFLGLQGAATPLPLHFSEFIVQDDPEESNLNDFFNFFNHQSYRALMQIDEKYSYVGQLKSEFDDVLSCGLMNLAGMLPAVNFDERAFYAKLFLGLRYFVGGRVSKQGLCVYLQKLYDLEKVELRERVQREIVIPLESQSALGLQNVALGNSVLLGSRFYSASLHLELHIFTGTVDRFLPGAVDFNALKAQLEFILSAPLFVTLVVHASRVPLFVLNGNASVGLGYNSVLSVNSQYLYFVRFDLV